MMKRLFILSAFLFLSLALRAEDKVYKVEKHTDANGYSYETVTNDPTGTRIYTLENGLKVYLSKNENAPRIQTYIPVRTGSNNDPVTNTGLAHYLEHMLFKGTSKVGALDWGSEKELLQQISDLYEEHKAEQDLEKRKEIYKKIDSISQIAATYVAANEYDKLMSSMGASGTNAHTWYEETVYQNNIPANELERWLELESERFSELVLRLFHTELEAVYEEFNRAQDNDFRLVHYAMIDALFPNHPYGQQTTIGTSEHLKTPSMKAIHEYFGTYYVPNNMAIVLVGDIEFDKTIALVDQYFGNFKSKPLPEKTFPREEPITEPIIKEVFSKEAERMSMAFRFDGGTGSEDEKYVTLIDMILANGKAGLIDLNINQAQKMLSAGCSPNILKEYTYHSFNGMPKQGQTLEEVRDLLLEQIEKVKKGEFPEWLIEATINDMELNAIRSIEKANNVASLLYSSYIQGVDWANRLAFYQDLRKISKDDIVKFANEHYKDNYVIVYKRQGENKNLVKVENPGITPIQIDRTKVSEFGTNLLAKQTGSLKPQFIDYKEKIKSTELNGKKIEYIINEDNDLFDLSIIFDMGSFNDKKLSLAVSYLEYLGTDKYTPEQIKQEFYKIGVSYSVSSGSEKSYISLSGLKANMSKGLDLLEHLLANVQAEPEAYKEMVKNILKSRKNAKTNKGYILRGGLMNFAKYGEDSPLRDVLSREELQAINPSELVSIIEGLLNYKHRIFYYGNDVAGLKDALQKYHNFGMNKEYPKAKKYTEVDTGNKVYFTDYDMVQAQLMMLRKAGEFSTKEMALSSMFNQYFGAGLSSIVFQEIRESKSLAYSAYAYYAIPGDKDDHTYVMAFIGTQANKLPEALDAMNELMNDMPLAHKNFEAAKESALKQIESQRITRSSIFWNYESLKKLGIDYDIRKDIYEELKTMTLDDLQKFFKEAVKGDNYTLILIGDKKTMPMEKLKEFGDVEELDVDYLFNNKE
ncbi:putative Zn-dependent peptidase [Balneicella halophila]|uniref:Putative Zn-dependent peptidase n=1 Tax=Balneicella halophila TaxID=1537566 RepID=A0A7L4URT8_BALHA|nr:M16 family metallopeptidase [Balneicella halophila]PVX52470.1 putative Zn-dependent peptidase [Balneicella halophila]